MAAPTAAFPTQLGTGTAAEFGPSQIANLTGQLPNLPQYLPFAQAQQSTNPDIQQSLATLSNYGNPSQLWNNPQQLQGLMGRPGTIDALSSLLGYAHPPAPTAPPPAGTPPPPTTPPTSGSGGGDNDQGGFGGFFGQFPQWLQNTFGQEMSQLGNLFGGGSSGSGGSPSPFPSSLPSWLQPPAGTFGSSTPPAGGTPAPGSAGSPSFPSFASLFGGSDPGNATTTPTTPQPSGSGTPGGSPFGGVGNWFQNAPGASQLQSPGGIFGAPLSGASAPSSNLFGGGF